MDIIRSGELGWTIIVAVEQDQNPARDLQRSRGELDVSFELTRSHDLVTPRR